MKSTDKKHSEADRRWSRLHDRAADRSVAQIPRRLFARAESGRDGREIRDEIVRSAGIPAQ